MHKIQEKEFTIEDFSTEHLRPHSIKRLVDTVEALNYYRDIYLNGGMDDNLGGDAVTVFEPKDKDIWWQMIQLLPSSYNQTRNIMMNYEVLSNIYKSRKNHKLDEWRELCKWIEELPYSELICGSESLKNNIEKALGHSVTPNVDIDDLKALTFVPNVAREAVGLKPVIEEKED